MAKKMSPLATDFEGINKSADERVLAVLTEVERPQEESESSMDSTSQTKTGPASPPKQEAAKKDRSKTKPRITFGKPTAYFSTRIPEEMAELLDDLVYMLRKKGTPKNKQELAHEALRLLLSKHGLC